MTATRATLAMKTGPAHPLLDEEGRGHQGTRHQDDAQEMDVAEKDIHGERLHGMEN